MHKRVAILLFVVAAGCGKSAPPAGASDKVDPATLPFVGKVWLSADFASPKGTMRIFLPNGTLVMDSCFETYRLSQWLPRSQDDIVWREDTAPVEAQVEQSSPQDLLLKIKLPREVRKEEYILASVPYVCPDMPR